MMDRWGLQGMRSFEQTGVARKETLRHDLDTADTKIGEVTSQV